MSEAKEFKKGNGERPESENQGTEKDQKAKTREQRSRMKEM